MIENNTHTIVYGEPMGKQRVRVTKFATYTPQKTVNFETLIKLQYQSKHQHVPFTGMIMLDVKAYFKIPKATSKKKYQLMITRQIRPTKKPDFDNIAKIVGDALNGVAFLDDKQIVDGTVTKWYSDTPRIEISVREIEQGE